MKRIYVAESCTAISAEVEAVTFDLNEAKQAAKNAWYDVCRYKTVAEYITVSGYDIPDTEAPAEQAWNDFADELVCIPDPAESYEIDMTTGRWKGVTYWTIESGTTPVDKDNAITSMEELETAAFEAGIEFKAEAAFDSEEEAKEAFNSDKCRILSDEGDWWNVEICVLCHGEDDDGIVAPWAGDIFKQ